jgi:hypothetical protein
MWSYVADEDRIPKDHPLRAMRTLIDPILRELSPRFGRLYAKNGRASIPPEYLLRALLLQLLYSVRSERMLVEQSTTIGFVKASNFTTLPCDHLPSGPVVKGSRRSRRPPHPGQRRSEGTIVIAPAIANAVFAATGVRLREVPFSAARYLAGARRVAQRTTAVPASSGPH